MFCFLSSFEKPKNQSEACAVINSVYPCVCFHTTNNKLTDIHKIIHEYHDTTLCLTIKSHLRSFQAKHGDGSERITTLAKSGV